MIHGMITLSHIGYSPRGLGPISLSLEGGEIVLLCGPSGSGKSTLCALLDGEFEPTTGQLDRHGRLARLGSDVESQLLGSTVGQELELGRAASARSEVVPSLRCLLERWVGRELEDPQGLSQGEQQILLLTSLALGGFSALVLDESLSCLDEAAFLGVFDVLREFARGGALVVVVSHEARTLGLVDRCLGLEDGKLIFDLPSTEVASAHLDRIQMWGGTRLSAEPVFPVPSVEARRTVLSSTEGKVALSPGEVLAVTGVTGSGKSRWLMAAADLLTLSGWSEVPTGYLVLLRQHAGSLLSRRSVRAELEASLAEGGRRGGFETLERVEIPVDWLHRFPGSLSQGQIRYLAALCLILQRPDVLFLDEPFSGLDASLRERLRLRLSRYLGDGGRVAFSTHRPDEVVLYGHTLLVLERERSVFLGSPWDYYKAQPDLRLGLPASMG